CAIRARPYTSSSRHALDQSSGALRRTFPARYGNAERAWLLSGGVGVQDLERATPAISSELSRCVGVLDEVEPPSSPQSSKIVHSRLSCVIPPGCSRRCFRCRARDGKNSMISKLRHPSNLDGCDVRASRRRWCCWSSCGTSYLRFPRTRGRPVGSR